MGGAPDGRAIVASPERIAGLDASRPTSELADPRGLATGRGRRLVRDLPVVVALVHGVHGNEVSSGGAAMCEAYHLLAAQNNPVAD